MVNSSGRTTGSGRRILSSAEIDNISQQVQKLSEAIDSAVTYSSKIIDGTVGSQIMNSYANSSSNNRNNVEELRKIVELLKQYNTMVGVMVDETRKQLSTQRAYTEGQNL